MRRNLDCQLLLFNNEIYGLTKGQYSPTSRIGTRSPSTPFGSVDRPVNPCSYRAGIGRALRRARHRRPQESGRRAQGRARPRGASFVEIYQNCVVYNDDVFAPFTSKEVAADKQLWLQAGEKMLFAGGTKGIALDMDRHLLKVVEGDSDEVLVHDPKNRSVAYMLVEMPADRLPDRARRHLRGSGADLRQRGDRAE